MRAMSTYGGDDVVDPTPTTSDAHLAGRAHTTTTTTLVEYLRSERGCGMAGDYVGTTAERGRRRVVWSGVGDGTRSHRRGKRRKDMSGGRGRKGLSGGKIAFLTETAVSGRISRDRSEDGRRGRGPFPTFRLP